MKNLSNNFKKFRSLFLIAKGQNSNDVVSEFNRYIGIGTFKVIGINPSKEELGKIYGRDIEKDPQYNTVSEKDGENIDGLRVSFIVTTSDDKTNNGIDFTAPFNIFLRDRYYISNKEFEDQKIKVIDHYGQTSWVTEQQLKDQEVPTLANGKFAKLIAPFRPVIEGEEQLIEFIRAYLSLPAPMIYKNESWVASEKLDEAVIYFDNIKALVKGNLNEVKEAINSRPDNKLKLMVGVRTTDDNKIYQDFFVERPMRFSERTHNTTQKLLDERKSVGAYPNTEFSTSPIHIYSLEPSTFKPEVKEETVEKVRNKWFNTK